MPPLGTEVELSGRNRKYTTKGRFLIAAIAVMTAVVVVLAVRSMMPVRQVERMIVPLLPAPVD